MRTIDELPTPAAIVDSDRLRANLDRMAAYARGHELALRPHIKTHKTLEIAREQCARGSAGVTCATMHEAELMSSVVRDVLIAYPPVGRDRLIRINELPDNVDVRVALDSQIALDALSDAAHAANRTIGVLIEIDVGMHRTGLGTPEHVVALAEHTASARGVRFDGVMFYPGHIREPVHEQDASLRRLSADLGRHLDALRRAGLEPRVVSGGSTPTAFASHHVDGLTEMRPGTYVFNDRTTAVIEACAWDDCAYSILATVISTAVPGQAVVDAGSKAINREDLRGVETGGYGALLDRPDIIVKAMSEEHGILDLAESDWQPRVGNRVRIVPNHVCISVNLHSTLHIVTGRNVVDEWNVAARGWAKR